MEDWYIIDGERRDGPYPTELMQAMLQEGELAADQIVQQGGNGKPTRVSDVEILNQLPTDASSRTAPLTSPPETRPERRWSVRLLWGIAISGFLMIFVLLPLMAVIIPIIAKVREQARQARCQDQFYSFIDSLRRYEETNGSFPAGWRPVEPLRSNYSWGTELLTEWNQSSLASELATGPRGLAEALTDPHLADVLSTTLVGIRCPSNELRAVNDQRPVVDRAGRSYLLTTSSYVANHGVGPWSRGIELNGVFGEDSQVAANDLVDGEATTILLGERGFVLFHGQDRIEAKSGLWFGLNGDGKTMRQSDVLAVGDGGINGRLSTHSTPTDGSIGYSSQHPGGSQFGYADGRAVMLNESIDEVVFYRLLQRADGATSQ